MTCPTLVVLFGFDDGAGFVFFDDNQPAFGEGVGEQFVDVPEFADLFDVLVRLGLPLFRFETVGELGDFAHPGR